VTCCTPEMESKLWTLSRETYATSLSSTAKHIQAIFQTKSGLFSEFFSSLLENSKRDFHLMFKKTYGILYERNSDVFTDFFKDLEAYYDQGSVDLEQALGEFFAKLYQRMFTVLNSQYTFDQSYLQCVSKNMKNLQPFGDVPKKLSLQLRRSFVATRTFAQALAEGKKIMTKILKIAPKDKCVEALTRMTSCPSCQGLPAIRPCTGYCLNVMKGCLAHHTELADSWDRYIDSLILVGERLIGPFNIEAVVEPIDIKISDAIMNFQESGYEVTQKVFEDCGHPRLGRRQASRGFGYNPHVNQPLRPKNSGTNLDNLVNDILTSVKGSKGFWTKLPYIMCENPEVGSGKGSVEKNCWNGRERGTYTQRIVNDGLASQQQNPEVAVDTSQANIEINEQIFALRVVINKLENAYNGHAVEWPHYESKYPNDSGYYGSGDCMSDDEDCSDGSGSGDDSDDDDEDFEGSGGDWRAPVGQHEQEDVQQAWPPPWDLDNDDNEVEIAETPDRAEISGSSTLCWTLLHYALPVLICCLGSLL